MKKISRTDWKYAVDALLFLLTFGVVAVGLLMAFVIPEGRVEFGQSKWFLGLHRHQWGDIHLYLSLAFSALLAVHLVLGWSWIKGKACGLFGKAWKPVLGLTALAAVAVPFLFWLALPKNDPAYAEFGTGRGRGAGWALEHDRALPAPPATAAPSDLERGAAETVRPAESPAGAVEAPRPEETRAGEAAHEAAEVAGRMEAGTAEIVITGQMTLREIERATGVAAADLAAKLGLPPGVSRDETLGRLRRAYGFEMQALRDAVAELRKARR